MRTLLVLSALLSAVPTLASGPGSIGAVGDSISAGFLAEYSRDSMFSYLKFAADWQAGKGMATHALSWSTGSDPRASSIALRFTELLQLPAFVPVANFSVQAKTAEDMRANQLPQLRSWSQAKLGRAYPELVTIFSGANDICADEIEQITPTDAFRASIQGAVDEVLTASPDARVLLVPMPRATMEGLQTSVGHLKVEGSFLTCQKVWDTYDLIGGCPTLLRSDRTAEQKAALSLKILGYNQAISEIAAASGASVRVAQNVAELILPPSELSIDCFHPNAAGQARLASESWAAVHDW